MSIITKSISDVKIGDMVIGPNGPVKVKNVIEQYTPNRMFTLYFDIGKVSCSDNHLWLIFDRSNNKILLNTLDIFSLRKKVLNTLCFGEINGPKLKKIKEVPPSKVCCIEVESDDHLFAIDLPKGKVYTHNCQFRAACGRLGNIASMMIFGNTMATTIDGSHPGAGMISANGSISSIQYYFENIEWIQKFYKTCGYDQKGHRKPITKNTNLKSTSKNNEADKDIHYSNQSNQNGLGLEDVENQENTTSEKTKSGNEENNDEIELEDLDSIFNFEHDITKIEIDGVSGEVDKTKKQTFDT